MTDVKNVIEKKLGCSIEEFVKKESAFIKEHPYECERPNPFREFTWSEFEYYNSYCKKNNLTIEFD